MKKNDIKFNMLIRKLSEALDLDESDPYKIFTLNLKMDMLNSGGISDNEILKAINSDFNVDKKQYMNEFVASRITRKENERLEHQDMLERHEKDLYEKSQRKANESSTDRFFINMFKIGIAIFLLVVLFKGCTHNSTSYSSLSYDGNYENSYR